MEIEAGNTKNSMNWAEVFFSTIDYKISYVPTLKWPITYALELEFVQDTTTRLDITAVKKCFGLPWQ